MPARLLVFMGCFAFLCSCDKASLPTQQEADERAGEISVTIRLSKIAAANISRAEVVVTGAGMADIRQNLTVTSTTITGTVRGIPAGANRLFTLNGYDASGNLTYTGSATATIVTGQQTAVHITMQSAAISSAGKPILEMQPSASAQRLQLDDNSEWFTTITGEISNSGAADATGVVISFRARNSSGTAIADAATTIGTVPKGGSKLFSADFPKADPSSYDSRYVSKADYTITYNEGSPITGTVTVQ